MTYNRITCGFTTRQKSRSRATLFPPRQKSSFRAALFPPRQQSMNQYPPSQKSRLRGALSSLSLFEGTSVEVDGTLFEDDAQSDQVATKSQMTDLAHDEFIVVKVTRQNKVNRMVHNSDGFALKSCDKTKTNPFTSE